MNNIAQRFAIIAAGAVLCLGTLNANSARSTTIVYDYITETETPFLLNVSGSLSFDDALNEPNERELTDLTMRWEVPEGGFNFDFSHFTSVPKFDQGRGILVGSWEVPDLANLLEVPDGWEIGKGTFDWGPLYFKNSPNISLYSDSYTDFRCNCGSPDRFRNEFILGDAIVICHAIKFGPTEVRYERVEEYIVKESVPEPSSALGLLAIGVIGACSVYAKKLKILK